MSDVKPMALGSNFSEEPTTDQLAAASYLLSLEEAVGIAYAKEVNIQNLPEYAIIDTPEKCLECLETFLKANVWLGHLFNKSEIWGMYLKSIAEQRFHVPLDLVLSMGGPADLILYLRACYRFGYQVISDQEYDVLEMFYLSTYPNLGFLNDSTNDEVVYTAVVRDAIKMSSLRSAKDAPPKKANLTGVAAALNAEKSTSVRPVRSYQEVYDFLLASPKCRTHWSLKMDGFNTKVLCGTNQEGIITALSRGRSTDSWDYTEAIRRVFKAHGYDSTQLSGKLTGESMVHPSALDYLREKYPGKDYKSPKSTAGAMLRAPQQFDEADYRYLFFYPFEYDEFSKEVAFTKLQKAGLAIPPFRIIEEGQIPLETLEGFTEWLNTTVLDPIWQEAEEQQIGRGGSDGVVLQLLTSVETDRADKYSDLNVALKFSYWTEADYESTVRKILFEQRRVEMSVVLEIDPVTTRDLNVATRVSVGSPAILVSDNVRVGDVITFARKSEAINIYLGKK